MKCEKQEEKIEPRSPQPSNTRCTARKKPATLCASSLLRLMPRETLKAIHISRKWLPADQLQSRDDIVLQHYTPAVQHGVNAPIPSGLGVHFGFRLSFWLTSSHNPWGPKQIFKLPGLWTVPLRVCVAACSDAAHGLAGCKLITTAEGLRSGGRRPSYCNGRSICSSGARSD